MRTTTRENFPLHWTRFGLLRIGCTARMPASRTYTRSSRTHGSALLPCLIVWRYGTAWPLQVRPQPALSQTSWTASSRRGSPTSSAAWLPCTPRSGRSSQTWTCPRLSRWRALLARTTRTTLITTWPPRPTSQRASCREAQLPLMPPPSSRQSRPSPPLRRWHPRQTPRHLPPPRSRRQKKPAAAPCPPPATRLRPVLPQPQRLVLPQTRQPQTCQRQTRLPPRLRLPPRRRPPSRQTRRPRQPRTREEPCLRPPRPCLCRRPRRPPTGWSSEPRHGPSRASSSRTCSPRVCPG
mmetsp:Transcript_7691/g.17767  ORF Transcript_7691/g.17767 Transcript_7691/m.17767 type:complete len:294 (+) Transcript_7691:1675-2556(+)